MLLLLLLQLQLQQKLLLPLLQHEVPRFPVALEAPRCSPYLHEAPRGPQCNMGVLGNFSLIFELIYYFTSSFEL
jgi:hypothetical protein